MPSIASATARKLVPRGHEDYDAIILDLGLPRMDGLTVLKKWREAGRDVPVLILTARGRGPNASPESMPARTTISPSPSSWRSCSPACGRFCAAQRDAPLRRSPSAASCSIRADAITVDGDPIALSPLEYRCLSYLMHHAGRVIPPTELMEHLYAHDHDREPNAVEVLIGRLRKKLGVDLIETRRGFGYVIPNPASP